VVSFGFGVAALSAWANYWEKTLSAAPACLLGGVISLPLRVLSADFGDGFLEID